MPKPARSEAGYRLYSERAVEELTFIRRAQAIGFSLDEIRGLLQVSRVGVAPCARVISLAGTAPRAARGADPATARVPRLSS